MARLSHPVLLGIIGAAHGVKGEVRVKSFTADPADLGAYGVLTGEDGRLYDVLSVRPGKEVVVARLKGVDDRSAAEALNGVKLYVERSALPPAENEDEFLHADLVGLEAQERDGTAIGRVVGIFDFGAGDVLEIKPAQGPSFLLPFTKRIVPIVDVAGGRVVVERPEEVEVRGD